MPPYRDDIDDDFGVGDYDLLSPPPTHQRPVSDVDGASSNRSSVTSVMSAGSLSSGCASVRSAHQSPRAAAPASAFPSRVNGYEPRPPAAARRSSSDTSADSGIALSVAVPAAAPPGPATLNGDAVLGNGPVLVNDADCLDYDVPVPSSDNSETVVERRSATPEQRCASAVHAQVVNSTTPEQRSPSSMMVDGPPRRQDNARCVADDVRRRRVDEPRDCVLRAVQRFLAWTGRATAAGGDAGASRQCLGQAKLAGLAVRTSLRQLVALVDGNPPELIRRHVDPINRSLIEIDRRVDALIAAGSTGGGRRAGRESSTGCRQLLLAVAEVVADLPGPVAQFADFVATSPAVRLRPPDDVDAAPCSPPLPAVTTLPPAAPLRRDSHQRDKPPLSPQSPSSAVGNPRARRPPIGKPPPVKPKPPKSVSWKRPPQTTVQPGLTNGSASRPDGTAHVSWNDTPSRPNEERRVAELNKKNNDDGWNDDDCDYVSIVREVEREMQSIRPAPTAYNQPPPPPATTTTTAIRNVPVAITGDVGAPSLNDDDRELLAFFSAQVRAHAADVDAATAEFYRCCCGPSAPLHPSAPPPSADAFVRRGRFVVLAAHRLVYVGDVIARHVTDRQVRDRVSAAANALCDRLKAVVRATRDAAVATSESASVAVDARQMMIDSVRRATDDSRRLCDVIGSAAA